MSAGQQHLPRRPGVRRVQSTGKCHQHTLCRHGGQKNSDWLVFISISVVYVFLLVLLSINIEMTIIFMMMMLIILLAVVLINITNIHI